MATELREHLQTTLGAAYTLERELGGGGMSRVFVAEETALGRRVVVKVLASAIGEGVNVERFKREVRVAARLQHPHIVPLLAADVLTDGVLYYTMPFVDGESLQARLAREGALPIADALRLLRDVLSALAYAHRHRVVHRDVKPANILLSDGGAVVTDFGIAKAIRAAREGTAGDTAENTGFDSRADTLTQLGTSVGTPQYMAPEQATGDVVDHRADLYALGVVAYEVLAGQPPFVGRTAQQLLAAHAVEAPEPITRRRSAVPAPLEALVMRLLEKNPADRPQSADEVLLALDDVRAPEAIPLDARERTTRTALAVPGDEGGPATLPAAGAQRVLRVLPWAMLVVAAAVIAILGAQLTRPRATAARSIAAAITTPSGIEPSQALGSNYSSNFALSPDGTQLAFAAGDAQGRLALWVRPLASLTATRVDGTDGASGPFWSPDGTSIGFFAGGRLRTLDLRRGTTRTLCPVSWAGGAAWTTADVIVYSPNFLGPLHKVAATGGSCVQLTRLRPGDFGHRTPSALPDGQRVLFNTSRGATALAADVTTGEIVEVRQSARDARFVAPDWVLFLEAENGPLYAQRLDLRRLRPVGEPRKVLDRVYTITGFANYTATSGAIVAQEPPIAAEAPRILWVNRQSLVVDSAVAPESVRRLALSGDGRRLALGGAGMWIYDRDRSVARRVSALTVDGQALNDAAWGPGDSLIAYGTARAGPLSLRLYHVATDVSDSLFTSERRVIGEPAWSPDGRRIAFTLFAGERAAYHEVWIYSLDTRRAARAWATGANVSAARWAPNGRWIAYVSDETGTREVYLRPDSGGGAATRISTAGGQYPRWRSDSRELYYQRADGAIMAVDVTFGAAAQLTTPRVVLPVAPFARTDRGIEVTSDGQQFVWFARSATPVFTLLLDWTARLSAP